MPSPTEGSRRTIWIARHAQRLDEADPGWRARAERPYDPPLSERGREQARALARRLAGEPIRHVFASPMLRTAATAQAAAESLDLAVRLEDGIFEWLSPRWFEAQPQRLPTADLAARFPRIDPAYRSVGTFPRFPEGREERNARAEGVSRRILESCEGDLLLVTHAALLVILSRVFVGRGPWIETENSALVKIVEDPGSEKGWRLALAGDLAHLESLDG
jgi:broad specificity phosphatase PhoE